MAVCRYACEAGDAALLDRCLQAALAHLPASKAAAIATAVTGVSRATAYARAVELKDLSGGLRENP